MRSFARRFARRFAHAVGGMIDRRLIAGIAVSGSALVGIVAHEGYSDQPIVPIKGDVLTIGFGHTGPDVDPGDKITPPQAVALALRDVQVKEAGLRRCITAPLHQYEYDAYVSLAYNVGTGAVCNSSIPEKLAASDYQGACKAILDFDKFKDRSKPKVKNPKTGLWDYPLVPLRGLTIRRQAEYRQCMGDAATP